MTVEVILSIILIVVSIIILLYTILQRDKLNSSITNTNNSLHNLMHMSSESPILLKNNEDKPPLVLISLERFQSMQAMLSISIDPECISAINEAEKLLTEGKTGHFSELP